MLHLNTLHVVPALSALKAVPLIRCGGDIAGTTAFRNSVKTRAVSEKDLMLVVGP